MRNVNLGLISEPANRSVTKWLVNMEETRKASRIVLNLQDTRATLHCIWTRQDEDRIPAHNGCISAGGWTRPPRNEAQLDEPVMLISLGNVRFDDALFLYFISYTLEQNPFYYAS